MLTRRWVLLRLILPLILAISTRLLHAFWPGNPTLELVPVFLPFLVAVLNLAVSSAERPSASPVPPDKSFNRKVAAWHALDGFSILILMLFEAVTAVVLSIKEIGFAGLVFTIPALFIPYALLALAARWYLLGAYTILVKETVAEPEVEIDAP